MEVCIAKSQGDERRCVGCLMCMMVCGFCAGVFFEKKLYRCPEECKKEVPPCVLACKDKKALIFIDCNDFSYNRRKEFGRKWLYTLTTI